MTETTGIATLLRFDDHERGLAGESASAEGRRASVGRPSLGTSVAIDCPDNTGAGEILVRSPIPRSFDSWYFFGSRGLRSLGLKREGRPSRSG